MLKWKHENGGLCRCCLAEGAYKNLSAVFNWMQEREVYAEMLKEVFDLSLFQVNEQHEGGLWSICDDCVGRLRDANSFKKQVLASENRFRELYKPEKHDQDDAIQIKSEQIEADIKVEDYANAAADDFDAFMESDDDYSPAPSKKSKKHKSKPEKETQPKKKRGRKPKEKVKREAEISIDLASGSAEPKDEAADGAEEDSSKKDDEDTKEGTSEKPKKKDDDDEASSDDMTASGSEAPGSELSRVIGCGGTFASEAFNDFNKTNLERPFSNEENASRDVNNLDCQINGTCRVKEIDTSVISSSSTPKINLDNDKNFEDTVEVDKNVNTILRSDESSLNDPFVQNQRPVALFKNKHNSRVNENEILKVANSFMMGINSENTNAPQFIGNDFIQAIGDTVNITRNKTAAPMETLNLDCLKELPGTSSQVMVNPYAKIYQNKLKSRRSTFKEAKAVGPSNYIEGTSADITGLKPVNTAQLRSSNHTTVSAVNETEVISTNPKQTSLSYLTEASSSNLTEASSSNPNEASSSSVNEASPADTTSNENHLQSIPEYTTGAIEGVHFTKIDENKYLCKVCGQNYHTRSSVRSHFRYKHLKVGHIPCKICTCKFLTFTDLRNHISNFHNMEPENYICEICKRAFTRKSFMERHVKSVHLNEKNASCPICGYKVFDKSCLKSHMKTHREPQSFYCTGCDKMLTRKETFDQHQKFHAGEKFFECEHCGKKFVQSSGLKVHVLRFHSQGAPIRKKYYEGLDYSIKDKIHVICLRCQEEFICKSDVYKHIKEKHDILVPGAIQCAECPDTFVRRNELKEHMEQVHNLAQEEHPCDQCDETFNSKFTLVNHKRAKHFQEKRYHCDCGHSTFTLSEMNRHKRTKHEAQIYECRDCCKTFPHKKMYLSHMATVHVHKDDQFMCRVCGHHFTIYSNMMKHMRFHLLKKTSVCPFCDIDLDKKINLGTHFKEQHPLLLKEIKGVPLSINSEPDAKRKKKRRKAAKTCEEDESTTSEEEVPLEDNSVFIKVEPIDDMTEYATEVQDLLHIKIENYDDDNDDEGNLNNVESLQMDQLENDESNITNQCEIGHVKLENAVEIEAVANT